MRIAMVSEHASPLAVLGGVDAGGQNVHVAALAAALGRSDDEVIVHTRRDDPALPRRVRLAANVEVLRDRQVGKDTAVLRNEAEPAARDLERLEIGDILAQKADPPAALRD